MPKFKVTIRDKQIVERTKVFEAESEEDAQEQAESEDWTAGEGWQASAEHTNCEIVFIEKEAS